MQLSALLAAPFEIRWHAFAALAALAIGIIQLVGPKGRTPHRLLGWIWVALMMAVAASSLFIHEIRLIGPFSPIHILSIVTLISAPLAVIRARRHQVAAHATHMKALFFMALVGAGLFTLIPGRLMGTVVLGFPSHYATQNDSVAPSP